MTLMIALALLLTLTGCNSGGGTATSNSGSGNGSINSSHPTETDSGTAGEDPLATYAWHLNNTGQSSFSSGAATAGQDISVKAVHDSGIKGAGIKIAVSDTGVDVNHPDLNDNQISGQHRDYSTDVSSQWRNGDPYPTEYEGHGTAVAGLAAAEGWNSIGSRGIAPSAKYAGFLFIGDFNTSETSYEAKTLDQMTGAFDIFNYSYGYAGCQFTPAEDSVIAAFKTGVTSLRGGLGAIYVKAVGNDYVGYNSDCITNDNSYFLGNSNTEEDQNHPYQINVAAMNAAGKIASYSTPGSGVWVSSLGGEFGTSTPAMISTDIVGCSYGLSTSTSSVAGFNKGKIASNSNCSFTSIMNGTSSATPVLSGVVALMLEANPNLSWRDVKHILAVTADKVNFSTAEVVHPAGTGNALTGYPYDYVYVTNAAGVSFSNTFGFGRVNAANAVTMAKTYTSALGTYREATTTSGTLALAIPDKSATGVSHSLSVSNNYTIESIQITLSTNHTYIGDLGVQLTSPSGTTSRILLVNSNIKQSGLTDFLMLTNAFYGESSSGTWTLKVVDGAATDTGNITKWSIKVNGH